MQEPKTLSHSIPSLNLGLIGNGSVAALVSSDGRFVWACLPRPDSTPVFDALLHSRDAWADAGSFAIEVEGLARCEQAYDSGTAVLRTRLWDERGQGLEIVDFAPRFVMHDRMFRPMQFVRRVYPLAGHPRIRVRLRPHGDWGRAPAQVTRGSHHLRYVLPDLTLRLNTNAPLTYVADGTAFELRASLCFLLGPDETLAGGIPETVRDFEQRTLAFWRRWTRRLALPLQWQDAVIRAAITLKLCQYEDTGAIVAALTTSVPEAPGSGRNWDYRYCGLRDAYFVVRALNSLAEVGTMEGYLRWLYNAVRGARESGRDGHMQPLYGIGLERALPESIVAHVPGYRGMGPVRVGNQAYEHFQHDVYGHIVLGAAQAFHDRRLLRPGTAADFAALELMGERAWALHDRPDAGIWELRTRERVHTSSVLMAWAACDRLARIARALALPERERHWSERADRVRRLILERAWHPGRAAFVESLDGEYLDASVLLMAEVGFLPAQDPRFVSTVDALERTLCDGPFMRRYEAADDFGRPEVAFNVCSFWRVDALARIGRHEQARESFEALLGMRNHVGLLSEDFAPNPATATAGRPGEWSGELWGNFPQTYSMVGIVNGAVRLSAPWDSVV
jgi:GH15 family glucan-1,4-alpha-glucosidase